MSDIEAVKREYDEACVRERVLLEIAADFQRQWLDAKEAKEAAFKAMAEAVERFTKGESS